MFLLDPDGAAAAARARHARRAALPALAALALVGLALLPLISAQGGHGTQWIGAWALSSRLQAIPQYYLTGYMGAPLGHGIELLVALPILAGLVLGLWRVLDGARASARRADRRSLIAARRGADPDRARRCSAPTTWRRATSLRAMVPVTRADRGRRRRRRRAGARGRRARRR